MTNGQYFFLCWTTKLTGKGGTYMASDKITKRPEAQKRNAAEKSRLQQKERKLRTDIFNQKRRE